MPRVVHVQKAQARYTQVPVIDPATGQQAVTVVQRKKPTKRGATTHTMKRTVADRTQPLPPETCQSCRKPIEVGTPYKWVQVRRTYGNIRYTRHEACPSWQPWDLSDSLSARCARIVHDAETAMQDAETADDITSAMTEAGEAIRELADEKRESADSIESGFGHPTSMSEELTEMADNLEAWADEVEGYQPDDAPEAPEDDVEDDEAHDEWEQAMEEWRETVTSEASDLLGQSPA